MSMLALCFPVLEISDYEFIQSIRRRYDRQYDLVDPHFTLVFEVADIDCELLVNHIAGVCRRHRGFDIRLRCATVVPGIVDDLTYLFLVPDEGYAAISLLHDELYAGVLADTIGGTFRIFHTLRSACFPRVRLR